MNDVTRDPALHSPTSNLQPPTTGTQPPAASPQPARALHGARGLSVLAGVVEDPIGRRFLDLLALATGEGEPTRDDAAGARAIYGRLFALLA
ncbi:MAG: hypothetical protein HY690_07155, partial [Chloroflexi bacterium]|nr:hypothetical protein [Chloroflexota bacterium]